MKKLIFFVALAAHAISLTTVTETLANVGNVPATGSVIITLSAPCTWNSTYITPSPITVQIVAGAFTTSLVPNDACAVQGGKNTTQYNVVWTINGQTVNGNGSLKQTWYVPSGGPFTVSQVLASAAPPQYPQEMISPAQISQYGATLGQALTWLGSNYGPATGGGGGGLVSSVFGRIGAILAQSGDYSCSQITGCLSGLTLQNSGSTIGTGLTTLNVQPDSSTIVTTSVVGGTGNVKYSINTAAVPSTAIAQAGVSTVADTGASGTSYAGCPTTTITALTNGMHITLIPAHASTGGATTFNLCTLGAITVLGWGTSNPAANDLLVNRPMILRYDSSFSGGSWVYTPDGTAPSGGGGSAPAPLFNTYANRPGCAAGNTGQTFNASEISNKHWTCDGTTWQPVAFDMQVVEPTALTWATIVGNGVDTPTITNVAGAVQLTGSNSTGGGYYFQGMLTPLSMTTPYTIEIAFTASLRATNSSLCQWGITNGNLVTSIFLGTAWYPGNPYGGVVAGYFDNMAIANRSPGTNMWGTEPVIRGKMVDDGTNISWYENTGGGWWLLASNSATQDMTSASYWGIGCQTYATGDRFQLTVYHASVHH